MKLIPLHGKYSNGQVALVSDEDYDRVSQFNWYYSPTHGGKPYVGGTINKRRVYLHRFILNAQPGETIDHADTNTLNNQRSNIRCCTQRENLANKRVFKTKALYRGVFLDTDRKNRHHKNFWQSRIKYNDQTIHLGRYSTAEEAAYIFDQASIQLNGEFARLNILND